MHHVLSNPYARFVAPSCAWSVLSKPGPAIVKTSPALSAAPPTAIATPDITLTADTSHMALHPTLQWCDWFRLTYNVRISSLTFKYNYSVVLLLCPRMRKIVRLSTDTVPSNLRPSPPPAFRDIRQFGHVTGIQEEGHQSYIIPYDNNYIKYLQLFWILALADLIARLLGPPPTRQGEGNHFTVNIL